MVAAWWACKELNNFGDVITPYIIKHFGRDVEHNNTVEHILMSGSVLSVSNQNSIILGAGFMSHDDKFNGAKSIELLRGVLSRHKIGSPVLVGDPAIILPMIYKPNVSKRWRVGIVPHYVDYSLVEHWESDLTHVINIVDPVESFINQINQCEIIVSSSLHGLITAQAYGIPAKWVVFSNNIAGDGFKFYDYIATQTDMSFAPQRINPKRPIELTGGSLGHFENMETVYKLIEKTICQM